MEGVFDGPKEGERVFEHLTRAAVDSGEAEGAVRMSKAVEQGFKVGLLSRS